MEIWGRTNKEKQLVDRKVCSPLPPKACDELCIVHDRVRISIPNFTIVNNNVFAFSPREIDRWFNLTISAASWTVPHSFTQQTLRF